MPKRKRSFCRRRRSESAPAVLLTSRRQSKRKQWADEEMAAAMSAVRNGMAIKRAAEEHGVPPSTLRDRISGRVVHGTKPGPRPYLSLDEEK
jgi:transposase-like protein